MLRRPPDKPNPTTGADGRAGGEIKSFSGLEVISKYALAEFVASAPDRKVR